MQRNLVTKLKKFDIRQNVINDLKEKSSRNDLKGIWKTIKLASNMAPRGNPQENNESNNLDSCFLNEHFSKVGYTIQCQVKVHENVSFSDFLPPAPEAIEFTEFIPVSDSEVENYIKSLASNKAIYDEIPLKIFKAVSSSLIKPLRHIINLSLLTGKVPSCCKVARVTPIFKSGDQDDPGNYRPISILPRS